MNLDLIKEKLANLEKKGGTSKHLWKPDIGKHVIRIVPYIWNKDWPFTELLFYYKLKKAQTVLSPQSFEKPDPVWEMAQELKRSGDTAEWKAGVQLEPKSRTYVPILVRGKEKEGVKFWGFGKTIYQEILKLIDDPDYGDISDFKVGRDLTVEVTKTDKPWPEITIRPKPDRTPTTKDPEVLELLKDTPNLKTLWTEPTYDELKKMLNDYLNNAAAEEGANSEGEEDSSSEVSSTDESEDIVKSSKEHKTSSAKEKKVPVKESSNSDDFDDLFK